jgi:hypothetical protein
VTKANVSASTPTIPRLMQSRKNLDNSLPRPIEKGVNLYPSQVIIYCLKR